MKIHSVFAFFALCALNLFMFNALLAQGKTIHITNGKTFVHKKRASKPALDPSTCPDSPFRSIDGTCNNISSTDRMAWGATDIPLWRSMPAAYGDPDPHNNMNGQDRLSARPISNALCAQTTDTPSNRNLSALVFTWGQFLDHDIDLTPEGHTEYAPILLGSDEPLFTTAIPFFRSEVHDGTGNVNPRQQTNLITAWIDASNVYGSDIERAHWLRTFTDGRLKTSDDDLLPYNTVDGRYTSDIDPSAPSMAGDHEGTIKTFVAGDVRAAEQPGLTALHTLFVRYHNQICDRLKDEGLQEDEEIYQRARKEVGAVIQAITYEEFLPALGVKLRSYQGYRQSVRPDISNVFATAAYRLGHTMVTNELLLKTDDCNDVDEGALSLLEGFFNIDVLRSYDLEPILNGLAKQVQNTVDTRIIDNLRSFLFGDPNADAVFGLDLASLNIQRGRDHGLPDYNAVRKAYTDRRVRHFDDITRDRDLRHALRDVYDSVDDIDPWVGLLAEDRLRNSSVGPTLHAILKSQFERLRDGDRFFYLNDGAIDKQQKKRITQTRLSDVIKACTDIRQIQKNVFFAKPCQAQGAHIRSTRIYAQTRPIQVAPNPSTDFIRITWDDSYDTPSGVALSDLQGRVIRRLDPATTHDRIDISDLESGLYFIRVEVQGKILSEKFDKVDSR